MLVVIVFARASTFVTVSSIVVVMFLPFIVIVFVKVWTLIMIVMLGLIFVVVVIRPRRLRLRVWLGRWVRRGFGFGCRVWLRCRVRLLCDTCPEQQVRTTAGYAVVG